MADLLKIGLGLLTLIHAGALLLKVFKADRLTGRVGWIGLSISLGTGGTAFLFFSLNMAGMILSFRIIALFAIICNGLAIVVIWIPILRRKWNPFPFGRLHGVQKILIGLILLVILLIFTDALSVHLNTYDSRAMWGLKSKILFEKGTLQTGAFLNPDRVHVQRDYPLLVPYAETFFYILLGRADDRLVKVLFPLLFFSLLCWIYSVLRTQTDRTWALIWTGTLALCPCYTLFTGGGVSSGMADVPLSLFVSISILSIYIWFQMHDIRWIILGTIGAGLALFTKKEDMALFLVLVLIFSFLTGLKSGTPLRRRIGNLLLYAGIPTLMYIPWAAFTAQLPDTYDVSHVSLARFMEGLDRVPIILVYCFQEITLRIHRWNVFWMSFLLVCILSIRSAFRMPRLFPVLVMALYSAVVWIPLITTPIPIHEILPSVMTRLFMHVLPIALVVMQGQTQDILSERRMNEACIES